MSPFAVRSSRSRLLFTNHLAQLENIESRADPRCGSQGNSAACDFDQLNSCCSQYGYCGNSSEFCQLSQGCQSGCSTAKNDTSISNNTWEFPSRTAKIGLITGGSVFGVSVVLIGLYVIWRCRRRRQKTVDLETDVESDIASLTDPVPAVSGITDWNLNRVCKGCLKTKPIITGFPTRRITVGCNHEPGLCRCCLVININASLAQDDWEQVICPENGCNSRLEEEDLQEFATSDDIQWYLARGRRTETRECQICIDERNIDTEFPNRPVTTQCVHLPACKNCIISTIRVAIDEGRWTNIVCPLCPQQLEYKDIAEFAANEDFTRYDRLSTRRAMEQIPNFRWCLREGCDSGQIHAPGEQLMLCNACGYEMCYAHQRPWHKGFTCQEFDAQNARRLRLEEAAVKAVIQRTTKPCPICGVNVEKVKGTCNHMTCLPPVGCGHVFCYECLVKWTGYGRRTTHKRRCSSYIAS